VAFNAVGVGTGSRSIDGLWQFHLGDDPDGKLGWAQPGFDDSQWERLPADRSWADAGHTGYTGFAWYRRQIVLDPADKNPLGLLLPQLDQEVEVYWNGVKVGQVGALPPHTVRYVNQPAVAIPLPTAPGAASGTLAIRIWAPRGADLVAQALQVGYAPVIQQMAERWIEHRLRVGAVRYALNLIGLCVGLPALVLWLRSRSQWILLCAGAYFVSGSIYGVLAWGCFSLSVTTTELFLDLCDWANHTAFLFLILLLAALPQRPGIRGFRFWKKVCLAASAVVMLGEMLLFWKDSLIVEPVSALSRFLEALPDLLDIAEAASLVLVLIACLVLGKPRLPQRLFMAAAALVVFIGDLSGYFTDNSDLNWISRFIYQPLFHIYGSNVVSVNVSGLLLLLAVIYAVWDQLSRELAEQRRANAELKAAQEVQTILVAAEERGAPGYAVASVYRPASEVGGDFFQVIPLDGDGTLIVAGDVSGKGLRAAMAVSLIVGAVRTLAEQDSSPAAVLAGLNRRLIGRTQGGFATCCAVRIDPTGHATMANAGHCQPYLDGREVELPAGLPLGLVDGLSYDEITLAISHEQQLTLVSDGVVEARNSRGELYGFERLSQLMQDRPTAEHVANTAIDFGQDDDITVLTVTRLAMA
jgi:Stage II sporulation protein E (SpoIIE)